MPLVLNPEASAVGVERRVELEASVSAKLRPHQREGILFMYAAIARDQGCILADAMGLGKTLQALGLVWAVVNGGPQHSGAPLVRKAVVVCPSSLCGNWRAEVRKWLGDHLLKPTIINPAGRERVEIQFRNFRDYSSHRLLIVSYEQLRRHLGLINDACDLLICDEGHRLRSQSATAQRLNMLQCRRRILLSGTPLQNDMDELFCCGRFVRPDLFPDAGLFQRLIAQPLIRSREPAATAEERELGADAAHELEERTSQFILRRTSEILKDVLPPRLELVLRLRMAPPQARAYRAVLAELRMSEAPGEMARALKTMLALRLLCNDAGDLMRSARHLSGRGTNCTTLHGARASETAFASEDADNSSEEDGVSVRGGEEPSAFWEACAVDVAEAAQLGASVKSAVLVALIQRFRRDAPSDQVVVVSNFKRTLIRLQGLLGSINVQTSLLCGSTPASRRMELVDKFNLPGSSGAHVLLLSSKAGGLGLNLIGANRLVLFDPDWNPANDAQAMARIWRDGQTKHVFIYRLVLGGTLEERICQRQHMKADLAAVTVDRMVEHEEAATGAPPRLSWEELRRVFQLEGYDKAGMATLAALCSSSFGAPIAVTDSLIQGALLDSSEIRDALLGVHNVLSRPAGKAVRGGAPVAATGAVAPPLPQPPWVPPPRSGPKGEGVDSAGTVGLGFDRPGSRALGARAQERSQAWADFEELRGRINECKDGSAGISLVESTQFSASNEVARIHARACVASLTRKTPPPAASAQARCGTLCAGRPFLFTGLDHSAQGGAIEAQRSCIGDAGVQAMVEPRNAQLAKTSSEFAVWPRPMRTKPSATQEGRGIWDSNDCHGGEGTNELTSPPVVEHAMSEHRRARSTRALEPLDTSTMQVSCRVVPRGEQMNSTRIQPSPVRNYSLLGRGAPAEVHTSMPMSRPSALRSEGRQANVGHAPEGAHLEEISGRCCVSAIAGEKGSNGFAAGGTVAHVVGMALEPLAQKHPSPWLEPESRKRQRCTSQESACVSPAAGDAARSQAKHLTLSPFLWSKYC